MEPSNAQRLKTAIRAELAVGEKSPDREIAASVTKADPGLVAAWNDENLLALVRQQRRHMPQESGQMVFPFDDLSVQIPLTKGEQGELRGMTIGVLKKCEKFLAAKQREKLDRPARANSLLGRIQREIEIMQPYVYGFRTITIEKVHALIAAGTPPPPRGREMSEAMKRYWAEFSPEVRSEMLQERQAKARRKARGAV